MSLTGGDVYEGRVGNILGKNDCKTAGQVPIYVAVEQPRPRVIRLQKGQSGIANDEHVACMRTHPEADRDVVVVRGRARRDDVAPDRVVVVVRRRASGADDREGVLNGGGRKGGWRR